MGCTPSILHHHQHANTTTTSNNNNHRNGPAEDGEGVPADTTGNSTHVTTGGADARGDRLWPADRGSGTGREGEDM